MHGPSFDPEAYFRKAWELVRIARPVEYTLFTFGDSELPYLLVVGAEQPRQPVSLTRGEITISRPLIITPQTDRPEFRHFFEDGEEFSGMIDFLLTRSAAFRNLKLDNHQQKTELVSDEVDEVVARLNQRLDREEEDRVAILTAPYGLGGVAVLKYAAERVFQSAPGNIQEMRERGFLPS